MDDDPASVRAPVRARPTPPLRAAAVVDMLWESAERQVADLHARVLADEQESDQRERDGRVMSVLVKTLRDLVALDDATRDGHDDADDESDARDIDEFRRQLARRIDALVAARADAPADGDAGA
jgi:hypothetical protein